MKKFFLILIFLVSYDLSHSAVFTLGAEIQPLIRYGGQSDFGYNGTLLRSGFIFRMKGVEYLMDAYFGGQTYGSEFGVGNYVTYPLLGLKNVELRLYGGIDLGLGLFRPQPVFAYALQGGLKYSIYMKKVRWVFNLGIRYHDSPWYSANISPMNTLDLPLYFGMEFRGKSNNKNGKEK